MAERLCKNCQWWDTRGVLAYDYEDYYGDNGYPRESEVSPKMVEIGKCRRFPDFKTTKSHDWCGEFAAKT